MDFRKYNSIENSYRLNHINRWLRQFPELQLCEYVLQEKIHGCNFQWLVTQDDIRFAKRSSVLEEDEKFYGYKVVMEVYERQQKAIQEWMKENDKSEVRVYGEMFGSNIQKGINYGGIKLFRIFDMMVDGEYLAPCDIEALTKELEIDDILVPAFEVVSGIYNAIKYDIDKKSLLTPEDHEGENKIEGVVIKPYRKVYSNIDGSPFYLKLKNEGFGCTRKIKEKKEIPADVLQHKLTFREYINKERLETIFSHEGMIESPREIGKFVKLVVVDAKEDYTKDFPTALELDKDQQGFIFNKYGGEVVKLLKEYL